MTRIAPTLLALVSAFLILVAAHLTAETPRFLDWCAEQGGVAPQGAWDPQCIRDGLVLIAPEDRNARWPG